MLTRKAGTVLLNKQTNQIGLVYRKKYGDLSFPKGHLEEDETLKECAIRETIEETGRLCHLIEDEPLDIMYYITRNDERIENYMYLAQDDGEALEESKDPEILVWVDIDNVSRSLDYPNLIKFWNKVEKEVKKHL
jgi:8-oxo-dGTP diphosphatase